MSAVLPTMHFLEYWRSTRKRLDGALLGGLPRFFRGLPTAHLDGITRAVADGQRLRGCLTCLVNDALGGRFEDALPRAVVIECIQAASLIHDDVVDGDVLRRGRPATWMTLGRRRAVLLGDLIFATALQRMTELSQQDGIAAAEAIATMASGAYQEPLAESGLEGARSLPSPTFYPRLIYLKTGVLFGTAARVGALAAGAPPARVAQAFDLGVQVGEAYQLADDLRDLIELDLTTEAQARAQWPLLAPLLSHFCTDTTHARVGQLEGRSEGLCDRLQGVRPRLRERMRAGIDARLQQAEGLVDEFPDNAHTALLQAAPAQITRLMLDS